MGKTYRKDKKTGIKFEEGNPKHKTKISYTCRCSWCTGEDKKKLEKKISKKELKQQLKEYYKNK